MFRMIQHHIVCFFLPRQCVCTVTSAGLRNFGCYKIWPPVSSLLTAVGYIVVVSTDRFIWQTHLTLAAELHVVALKNASVAQSRNLLNSIFVISTFRDHPL